MNILVTGCNGFLGREVCKQLLAKDHQVVGYDRSLSSLCHASHFDYVQGDLADLASLLECCQKWNFSAVIHTAAISHPVDSRRIPLQTVLTNVVGTTHVFECARLFGIKRVVNLSSECAYGHNAELKKITENAALNPTTPYGCSKVFTEKLGQVYSQLYHVSVVSLRPGWIYGPGQFMQCYLKSLLRSAIDGTPLKEEQGACYLFQYVHVSDVAAACLLATEITDDKLKQRVFNITAGEQESYASVANKVKKRYPNASIEIGSGAIDILDSNAKFDISAACEQLGYAPQYALDKGLNDYATWLEANPF